MTLPDAGENAGLPEPVSSPCSSMLLPTMRLSLYRPLSKAIVSPGSAELAACCRAVTGAALAVAGAVIFAAVAACSGPRRVYDASASGMPASMAAARIEDAMRAKTAALWAGENILL